MLHRDDACDLILIDGSTPHIHVFGGPCVAVCQLKYIHPAQTVAAVGAETSSSIHHHQQQPQLRMAYHPLICKAVGKYCRILKDHEI